jgi:hypothetical protein
MPRQPAQFTLSSTGSLLHHLSSVASIFQGGLIALVAVGELEKSSVVE